MENGKGNHPRKISYPDLIKRLREKEAEKDARELLVRSQRTTKKKGEKEHLVQSACVRWFGAQYPQYKGLLFAVPNGGKRDAVVAAKLKAEGVVAGVSDLMLAVARPVRLSVNTEGTMADAGAWVHGLFIETKTEEKHSRQSPSQRLWQKKVEEQGYQYEIFHSLEEFMKIIKDYLSA